MASRTLPDHSVLAHEADRYAYQDIQWRPLQRRHTDITPVISAFLGSAPPWVDTLMRLRDRMVGPLGLVTAQPWGQGQPQPPFAVGQRLGIFRLLALQEREVIMGENDRHLDFRISLLLDGPGLYMSTLVRPHNIWGRLYLRVVLPFHHLIVASMAGRLVRQLDAQVDGQANGRR